MTSTGDDQDYDDLYGREQASKWTVFIQNNRRLGIPVPPVEVALPFGACEPFRRRLAELLGAEVIQVSWPVPLNAAIGSALTNDPSLAEKLATDPRTGQPAIYSDGARAVFEVTFED